LFVCFGIFTGFQLNADACKDACIQRAENSHQARVAKIESNLIIEFNTIIANAGCSDSDGPAGLAAIALCKQQAQFRANEAKRTSASTAAGEKAACKDCEDPDCPFCE
jgi:hypothetical protein